MRANHEIPIGQSRGPGHVACLVVYEAELEALGHVDPGRTIVSNLEFTMENLHVEFHPLTEADLPLLCDWLNRPHLQAWWRHGTITLEDVREKYLPRIVSHDTAHPYLAYIDGQSVGYIQYYTVGEGTDGWWQDEPGPGVIGIDQFLADVDRLGKGLGTAMVSQFVAYLMKDPAVIEIRVDPRPDNLRAIRCYAKVGFCKVRSITTPDGPALMMVLKRRD